MLAGHASRLERQRRGESAVSGSMEEAAPGTPLELCHLALAEAARYQKVNPRWVGANCLEKEKTR